MVWRQVLDREGVAKNGNVNGMVWQPKIRATSLDIAVVSRWKSIKHFFGFAWAAWSAGDQGCAARAPFIERIVR